MGGGSGDPGTGGGAAIGAIPTLTGIDAGNGAGAEGTGGCAGLGASFTGSNFDPPMAGAGGSGRDLGGKGATAGAAARFGEAAR